MSGKTHTYTCSVTWTGNTGTGTSSYRAYSRDHIVAGPGKPELPGSADPAFRGDAKRYNPEELLLASLSTCHMLWYLHLCADAKVTVVAYRDEPLGHAGRGRQEGRLVQQRDAAPESDDCEGQRRRQGPRPAPPCAREMLHRQFRQLPRGLRA